MPQATALSPGSLLGQDVIRTAATPLMGHINIYNASDVPLSPILRQASLGTLGTTCLVGKDSADISNNTITITCYPGETFHDGTTTRELIDPGSFLVLALLANPEDGIAKWKVVGSGQDQPPPANFNDSGSAATVCDNFSGIELGTAYGGYGGGSSYGYGGYGQ